MSDNLPIRFFNKFQDFMIVTDKNGNGIIDQEDAAQASKKFDELGHGDFVSFYNPTFVKLREQAHKKLKEVASMPFLKGSCTAPKNDLSKQEACLKGLNRQIDEVKKFNTDLVYFYKGRKRFFECGGINFIESDKNITFNFLCQKYITFTLEITTEEKPEPAEIDLEE